MRSDAKASTAGSNQRRAIKRKPSLLLLCLAACVAALAVVVGSASASKSHAFKELFGSAAQPTFTSLRGIAVDQSSGDVLVMDAGSPPSIKRYNPDGTADEFSALSSNVIDGAGGADATPQAGLSFASASESQIAIDNSGTATDGDIYVTQGFPNLINVFASSGEYLGQLTAAGATSFSEACGIAVDPSGAVYVGDYSAGVKKFVPAANPVVNADHTATFTTTTQPCTLAAGAGASAGFLFPTQYSGPISKIDSSTGELKYTVSADSHTTVSVDPETGHVYGATGSNIKEFDASGAGSATQVSATKLSSGAQGVAVRGSSGDIFVSRSGQSKVEVFGSTIETFPDVVTSPPTSNTGVRATLAGTVNPDGVELSECKFEWSLSSGSFGNTVPCAESNATIGSGTSPVAVHADLSGLTPQGASYKYRLVAKNAGTPAVTGSQQNFTTPNTVITTAASGATPTTVTLNGTVNPDTATISACIFEWGPEQGPLDLVQTFPETAACVPGPGGITGTSPVAVHADLSGLHPGTSYVYRLRATYPTGAIVTGEKSTQTTGPRIVATWSENVSFSEATLKAEIDPEGAATTYRFEYGTTEAYGSETEELNVGSDSSVHKVSRFLEGLEPGTTYHYRAVATNGVAENLGPDHVLNTFGREAPRTNCANQAFRAGPAALLPDCRGYEMVSPVDKNNDDIRAITGFGVNGTSAFNESSITGHKLTFTSHQAFGDAPSAPYAIQYVASRGAAGWSTHGITPPSGLPGNGLLPPITTNFQRFTPDLSKAWLWLGYEFTGAAGALGYENLYSRDNTDDSYVGLTPDVPPNFPLSNANNYKVEIQGVSADGSRVVFRANDKLTPDAPTLGGSNDVLYEWSEGELHLVSVLPGGEPSLKSSSAGTDNSPLRDRRSSSVDHAISDDGSRIFWTTGGASDRKLFVRLDGEATVPVSESVTATKAAQFWTAAADGSKVLFSFKPGSGFSESEDLYEFDVDSETPSLIAHKTWGVPGAADDLSYVYFVSEEALDTGAVDGQKNLYVDHEGTISFVALYEKVAPEPKTNPTRVTPDGAHIAFLSGRSLTGYDNTDALNGKRTLEVYVYDAPEDELICASCNPSGARPVSRELDAINVLISGWSAANFSTWTNQEYATRALSDDGNRVFFDAYDALVPRDTNGRRDVYQWEAQGTGGCEKVGGCVDLISSGENAADSEFVDASADGSDVFFYTAQSIAPQDPGLIDIYDARVGGGYPPPPPPPPPCVGDACQSPPGAPNDPSAASAGFHGAGNPRPHLTRNCGAQAKRAVKLSRRAKLLLRKAKRAGSPGRAKLLRRRSALLAKKAKGFSKRATRCRRANRRAAR